MLVKISEKSPDQFGHSDEQYRILNQLTRIDQHLKGTNSFKSNQRGEPKIKRRKQSEAFNSKKRLVERDQLCIPIDNTNMEYFSEIGTQDVEDDSLFDPQQNFLAPPKPFPQNEQKNNIQHNKSNMKKNSIKQPNPNPQIVKQLNYAYKKQFEGRLQASKGNMPPRSNKVLGTSSSSQSYQRKVPSNLKRNQTSPDNLLKKNPSKEKYLLKNPIMQEKYVEDDPSQFKFHTFEPYLESSSNNENSSKIVKKIFRAKTEYEDKTSLQCTFKPTILKRSAQMAKNNKNIVERLSTSGQPIKEQKRPYQHQQKQSFDKSRIQELSQPRRLKTLGPQKVEEVPSFRPSLSKKSLQQMSHCMYDVATRNLLWQRQKDQKIQKMRQQEQRQKQKRENCSHVPTFCQYRGQNAPNLSRFGREGIQNYFERVSGFNKVSSRSKLSDSYKQNRQSGINMSKQGYNSKGVKKQKYQDAVRQLHSRIMGLKI